MRIRLLLCVHFLLLSTLYAWAQKPCDISASIYKGCIPLPVEYTFTTGAGKSISSYDWDFGDGQSATQAKPTHIYKTSGDFITKITVTFADGSKCTVALAKPVKVLSSPNVDFNYKDKQVIVLCSTSDAVCFFDKSTPGDDKAPIVGWLWSYGDGSVSSQQNPCYNYSDSGTYTITLEVTDTNGCKNYVQKKIIVKYLIGSGFSLNPKFTMNAVTNCKDNSQTVTFTNTTDTTGKSITKFIWDYGDGTMDSCNLSDTACLKKWLSRVHVYKVNGSFRPTLYFENRLGCMAKVSGAVVKIATFKINFTISPPRTCYAFDSTISFSTTAGNAIWDFGDPNNRALSTFTTVKHSYTRPGTYTIRFRTTNNGCTLDTVVCKYVVLNGPVAKIEPYKEPSRPWETVPPGGSYLIAPGTYFDTTCWGTPVTYYTYTPTLVKNGKPVYDGCNMDVKIKTLSPDSLMGCDHKNYADTISVRTPHVNSYKDTTIQTPVSHIWKPGSPIPASPVYSAPPYVPKPLYMDDTMLFPPRCSGPQKVAFTNFSVKYRGYDAIDNFPLEWPDTCLHKTYPYATDSLSYYWSFEEGTAGVSTKTSPDIRKEHSTEKMPTHLFQKDGCYMVVLQVTDPVTGCTDFDSVPVVLQAADAGWSAELNVKNMTQVIQKSIPQGNYRRGLMLTGRPCTLAAEAISVKESLPSCYKNSYAIVFDSAEQVKVCGSPPIKKFNWIFKDAIEKLYHNQYVYSDTGWKTLGFVVSNNANCTDTVWYHNYFYIHPATAKLQLSGLHVCLGDTLKITPANQDQPGIQTFMLAYTNDPGAGLKAISVPGDTFRYQMLLRGGGKKDTVTSTSHNPAWGDDDGPYNFNYLKDTIKKVFTQPGHVVIQSSIYSRYGCADAQLTVITVGHYSDFKADNNVVCVNTNVNFTGNAQYFVPYLQNVTGLDPKLYWKDPIGIRVGRNIQFPEEMQWDLDGDGIIDYTGLTPSFKYTKTGSYTVVLYTRDSLGCVQKFTKKDFIKIIDANAYFTVAPPGDVRYCGGSHFFNFIDSSYVFKVFKDSLNLYRILSWKWDFGDGTAPITITDSSKRSAGHVYLQNGDYKVTLTASTTLPGGLGGCANSFSRTVHILGPIAHFTIDDNEGCVPFTIKVHDLSSKARVREFLLGDGTTYTSNGDSIVYLTYTRPGVFCPQLFVADTLTDQNGHSLYCADTFPVKCAIKVYVNAINVQKFTGDTIICLGETTSFKSEPDTGYKTWTINYGDGDTNTAPKPKFNHKYEQVGRYHLTLTGTGAKCPVTSSLDVRVVDIKSDFALESAVNDTPVFRFKNLSVNAVKYSWDFGDGTPPYVTTSADPVSHEFQRSGKVTICLTAYNERGCPDVSCHDIFISTFLSIPNVFTPQGDAYNNHFVITIYGQREYDLTIYNRWGQKLFQSNDKNITWDGRDQATGNACTDGAYYYVLNYRFIGEGRKMAEGAVTLLRK